MGDEWRVIQAWSALDYRHTLSELQIKTGSYLNK